jgi:hypothetical protein
METMRHRIETYSTFIENDRTISHCDGSSYPNYTITHTRYAIFHPNYAITHTRYAISHLNNAITHTNYAASHKNHGKFNENHATIS